MVHVVNDPVDQYTTYNKHNSPENVTHAVFKQGRIAYTHIWLNTFTQSGANR